MKYLRVWKQLTLLAFSTWASNRIDAFSYWLGKLVRFGFFWWFISSIFSATPTLAGYGKYEALLFFLTFNLVDVVSQAFFRGIYMLGGDINKGNFDYTLTKPVHPLFYSLSRLTDILDFIFLIPLVIALVYTVDHLDVAVSLGSVIAYLTFILVSVILVLAIHVLSAAVTLIAFEADQVLWLYREAMTLGRFPPEILSPSIQFIFTYFMPIILIVAYPTKIMLGLIGWGEILTILSVTAVFGTFALFLWNTSLRRYSSASS